MPHGDSFVPREKRIERSATLSRVTSKIVSLISSKFRAQAPKSDRIAEFGQCSVSRRKTLSESEDCNAFTHNGVLI